MDKLKRFAVVAIVCMAMLFSYSAGIANAQQTYTIKNGQLIHVSSKKLVKGYVVYKNILYDNGKKYSGTYQKKRYVHGAKWTGYYKNLYYVNGVVATGVYTVKGEKETFKKGVLQPLSTTEKEHVAMLNSTMIGEITFQNEQHVIALLQKFESLSAVAKVKVKAPIATWKKQLDAYEIFMQTNIAPFQKATIPDNMDEANIQQSRQLLEAYDRLRSEAKQLVTYPIDTLRQQVLAYAQRQAAKFHATYATKALENVEQAEKFLKSYDLLDAETKAVVQNEAIDDLVQRAEGIVTAHKINEEVAQLQALGIHDKTDLIDTYEQKKPDVLRAKKVIAEYMKNSPYVRPYVDATQLEKLKTAVATYDYVIYYFDVIGSPQKYKGKIPSDVVTKEVLYFAQMYNLSDPRFRDSLFDTFYMLATNVLKQSAPKMNATLSMEKTRLAGHYFILANSISVYRPYTYNYDITYRFVEGKRYQ